MKLYNLKSINLTSRFIAIALFIITLASVLTNKLPIFGKIGTIFWFGTYFFLASFFMRQFIGLFKTAFVTKKFLTLFTVISFISLVLFYTTDPKSISFETTQELGCAITSLKESVDWGFNSVCLYGYPMRQFLLPSLPSLLFGKSIFLLHLGGSFYFIIGIVIFATGLLKLLHTKKNADIIVATILTFILHVRYFNFFMFMYEQSIFPFSFALMLVGLLFHFISSKKTESLLIFITVLFYSLFSYTPALSLFMLGLGVLFYLFFQSNLHKKQKLLISCMFVLLIISFLSSYQIRGDIHFAEQEGRESSLIRADIIQTMKYIFTQAETAPVSQFLFALFLVITLLSVFSAFGWKIAVVAWWMLGVFIIAGISKGYAYYGIDFRLHRAIVIFPIFFAIIAYLISRIELHMKGKTFVLSVLFIFFFTSGIYFHRTVFQARHHSRNVTLLLWFTKIVPAESKEAVNDIFFDKSIDIFQDDSYSSFDGYLPYFLPKSNSSFADERCSQIQNSQAEHVYVFIPAKWEQSYCFEAMQEKFNLLGTFEYMNDKPIQLYTKSVR